MEDQCSPFSWDFCYQEEGTIEDQLRHSLLYTTLELETTVASAKEKILRRDQEVLHLKDVLNRVIKERDDAKIKCRRLMLEKLMLQQQLQKQQEQEQEQVFAPLQHQDVVSKGSHDSSKDDAKIKCRRLMLEKLMLQQQLQKQQEQEQEQVFAPLQHQDVVSKGSHDSSKDYFPAAASSDSDENIVSSPNAADQVVSKDVLTQLIDDQKELPEKGKLLQAVIDAGPLLQTLLLAGPLPQWQHPPPQINSIEIPPVSISPPTLNHLQHHQDCCFSTTSKRSLLHSDCSASNSDSSPKTKSQKVVLY